MSHFTLERNGEVHDAKRIILDAPKMTFEQALAKRTAVQERLDTIKAVIAERAAKKEIGEPSDPDEWRALKFMERRYGSAISAICARLAILRSERHEAAKAAIAITDSGKLKRAFVHHASKMLPDDVFRRIAEAAGFPDEMTERFLYRDFEDRV